MMKNGRKTSKRKLSITCRFLIATLIFGTFYLAASIFLRSHNQDLTKQIAQAKQDTVRLKAEVDAITIQIDQLSNQKRVMELVNDDNMAYIENNIITISN